MQPSQHLKNNTQLWVVLLSGTTLNHLTSMLSNHVKDVSPSFSWLGQQAYEPMIEQLKQHAHALHLAQVAEHVFCCEHQPIYTTGRRRIDNRQQAELPAPLIFSDRGGETTFHGTGQLMLYPVINLKQRKLAVSCYVSKLERSCMALCASLGVQARQRSGFPGVWIGDQKIAAVGLRVRHGIAYHGMALNVCVDVTCFDAILGCGLDSKVVNLQACTDESLSLKKLSTAWFHQFCLLLGEACESV
ncbi:MAG: lipoyl(octanoyl) transferase LipB [Mariprofundaceae bacterium]|nr:lipoyl(octanoyl) transferase LipB [Mariprofundaceae bacterium]